MKYLLQFVWILLFSFLGEMLHAWIPLPIPASVYGMVLLFTALLLGVIRLEQVADAGHFLVSLMPVMFVCPAAGLLGCWEVVSRYAVPVCVIIVVSLVLTFFASGWVTQRMLGKEDRDDGDD